LCSRCTFPQVLQQLHGRPRSTSCMVVRLCDDGCDPVDDRHIAPVPRKVVRIEVVTSKNSNSRPLSIFSRMRLVLATSRRAWWTTPRRLAPSVVLSPTETTTVASDSGRKENSIIYRPCLWWNVTVKTEGEGNTLKSPVLIYHGGCDDLRTSSDIYCESPGCASGIFFVTQESL